MTVRKFELDPALFLLAFMPPSAPRALLPGGWVTLGEAIAWVGFGQALPVEQWDRKLMLGLSCWPWNPPMMVPEWLGFVARDAVRPSLPYQDGWIPGHRFWLRGALRQMGSHRPMAGLPPESAEVPDLELRAEAARRCEAWDEATHARVSAAFLTATLASDALRLSAAESALTLFGIPTGREGAEVHLAPLAPREAVPPALCAAPVILTPDGLYPFTPDDTLQHLANDALWQARRSNLGPSYVEVLVPARDLARVFPRTPGKAPDLLAAALQREPEPGEADAIAVQQGAKSGLVPRTGTAGRPSSMHLVHPEHRRRIEAGEAHASLAAEAKHLKEWLRQTHPEAPLPGTKALQNAIRYDHPEHLKSRPKINRRG